MLEDSIQVRIQRSEQDIEMLRWTQNRILDLIERFAVTRPDASDARLDSIIEIERGNRDLLRAIAKRYNVTQEWPERGAQSD